MDSPCLDLHPPSSLVSFSSFSLSAVQTHTETTQFSLSQEYTWSNLLKEILPLEADLLQFLYQKQSRQICIRKLNFLCGLPGIYCWDPRKPINIRRGLLKMHAYHAAAGLFLSLLCLSGNKGCEQCIPDM